MKKDYKSSTKPILGQIWVPFAHFRAEQKILRKFNLCHFFCSYIFTAVQNFRKKLIHRFREKVVTNLADG